MQKCTEWLWLLPIQKSNSKPSTIVQENNSSLYQKCKEQYLQFPYVCLINPLAQELVFLILAHPVYKIWIIQEPNKLALWNKLHFEEEKTENIEHV